jgi:hypothetical protein
MSLHSFLPKRSIAALILVWHFVGVADAITLSEPRGIWHCSRNLPSTPSAYAMAEQDEFKLSSMDTIGVTLTDLLNVYLGKDVSIGGLHLVGCYMPGQEALSKDILKSLDLKSHVLQKLSAKNAIAQGHVITVIDETQMQACLESHFPAFGYLSRETISEKFAPCF